MQDLGNEWGSCAGWVEYWFLIYRGGTEGSYDELFSEMWYSIVRKEIIIKILSEKVDPPYFQQLLLHIGLLIRIF